MASDLLRKTMMIEQRVYKLVRCSDADRDGIALEIVDIIDGYVSREVIEIFYWDADGRMTLTLYRPDVPVALIEWSIRQAHALLPPLPDSLDTPAQAAPGLKTVPMCD